MLWCEYMPQLPCCVDRRCRMSMMLMAGWLAGFLAVETVTCQSLSDDLISHRCDTRGMR
jgi:hypothetical protein